MIAVNKKKLIFVITGAVLIFAAALLIFDSILINRAKQTSQLPNSFESTSDEIIHENSSLGTEEHSDAMNESSQQQEQLLYSEQINVAYNTPEYDMELLLCVNNDKNNFIRLRYYKDGASTEEELRENDIPELSEEYFKISQALLNPVYSQMYLLIQDDSKQPYSKSSLYRISLEDLSVKQLSSYNADFSELLFNYNFKLMAYSFEDPKYLSSQKENNLLEVYDCLKDEYIIKASKDKNNNIIGENSIEDLLYDYELEGWETSSVLRLIQAVRSRTELKTEPIKSQVLYDIDRNLLLDKYGNELKFVLTGETESGDGSSENSEVDGSSEKDGSPESYENPDSEPRDTEPAAVLKEFYNCLSSPEDYSRGMEILDSDFRLKMSMLKQFGVEEISKNDIDSESASLYSELLRGAKFDIIAGEVQNGDIYVITYYHKLSFGAQSDVRQLMSAHLKKHDKHWKIILIEDGIL